MPANKNQIRRIQTILKMMRQNLQIKSTYNLVNSRVPKNRQTENLGDFD